MSSEGCHLVDKESLANNCDADDDDEHSDEHEDDNDDDDEHEDDNDDDDEHVDEDDLHQGLLCVE